MKKSNTTKITEIKMVLKECYEQLYANQLDNLGEVNKL
jgi:hypothetical protein